MDQAHELRKRMKVEDNTDEAHTIGIFSGKGGVGKSNFALNFSIGLAKQGKKVLIFDLDIGMGNIDILLGLYPKQSLATMLQSNLDISDIIEKGPSNLSYISGGTALSDFFHLSEEQLDYFTEQLSVVSEAYDYIIFDLGAGMSEEHLMFLAMTDECFVVSTTEPTSITDAYAAMKHLLAEQPKANISLLVNRVANKDEADLVFNRLHTVVEKFLGYQLNLLGSLPDDSAMTEAVKNQTPFYIHNSRSKLSKTMGKMVLDYLVKRNDEPAESSGGFVSKFKSIFNRKVD
ncbi:MinD/ParA family protein [Halalkalibacillus sediminis]|nr:MinD/ParA family protein [Halalkalibacillus sediminis]